MRRMKKSQRREQNRSRMDGCAMFSLTLDAYTQYKQCGHHARWRPWHTENARDDDLKVLGR